MNVEQVAPGQTVALRQRVLRPHETVAELAARAEAPGTIAFAALDGGRVIGTALVLPEPFPDQPDRVDAWRLRGMATDPDRRDEGVGSAVLGEAITQLRNLGAKLLWCNARIPARRFYERAGLAVSGEPWDEPDIGPHLRMWRDL